MAWSTALLAFLDANLQAGIDVVLDETRFQESERCSNCYYREGKMDEQTIYGKTPIGVAKVAKAYDIPVIAICGSLGDQYQEVYRHGIDTVFSITEYPSDLKTTLENGPQFMQRTATNIARLIKLNLKLKP